MKKLLMAGFALCLGLMLAGCNTDSTSQEEKEVIAAAEQVISQLHEGDYEAIVDNADAVFQQDLNAVSLQEVFLASVEGYGSFEKINEHIIDITDDEIYDDVICQYENGTFRYTLIFSKEMKLKYMYTY